MAVFIGSGVNREGWVKEVLFRVKKMGECKNSFRIRLLKMDTSSFAPAPDILNENVVVNSIDLKNPITLI